MILDLHRPGLSVAAIARETGKDVKTIRRHIARGLKTPEFLIIDGGAGLEKALAALWPEVPTQRCTVHKHSNLLAHAPDHLHEEVSADYRTPPSHRRRPRADRAADRE